MKKGSTQINQVSLYLKLRKLESWVFLNPREKRILKLRFKDGKTLRECGKIYGVTKERIRQLQAKAEERLRMKINIIKLK